jgi:hypothetical protein
LIGIVEFLGKHPVAIPYSVLLKPVIDRLTIKFLQTGLVLATEKFWSLRKSVLPKVAETVWGQLRVANSVLNILMPQVVLNRSSVVPVID